MKVTSIKTHKITKKDKSLEIILDKYLNTFHKESILVVTSKIVSICEGRIVDTKATDKQSLIEQESEYYLPPEDNKYNFSLTITNNNLTPAAGIDESNADKHYVLWPKNPQLSANNIREYLVKRFKLNNIGVIITDSRTVPLKWGTIGTCIAHSGFVSLNDYREKPDIFGREMKVTQANVAEAIAVAAVAVMGEGNEQTPLAIVEDVSFVKFQERNPTDTELKELMLEPDEDIYAPLLTSVKWKKGKNNSKAKGEA